MEEAGVFFTCGGTVSGDDVVVDGKPKCSPVVRALGNKKDGAAAQYLIRRRSPGPMSICRCHERTFPIPLGGCGWCERAPGTGVVLRFDHSARQKSAMQRRERKAQMIATQAQKENNLGKPGDFRLSLTFNKSSLPWRRLLSRVDRGDFIGYTAWLSTGPRRVAYATCF